MSHYNRFSLKKKLSLVLVTILTHFAFETKINVPFDLQNSVPALLKPHLEELYSGSIASPTLYGESRASWGRLEPGRNSRTVGW